MFDPNTDEKLISKALNGSQRSWVKIVDRYEGLIYNYCLRMTWNSNDAMDLMQEVFLSIFRNLPSYRGHGQFKAWMMRIAVNKSIDYLRNLGRNPQHRGDKFEEQEISHGKAPEFNNPDFFYEQLNHNQEIKNMMLSLSIEQRMVVELKFFQHFTFEEISYQTGTPVNTVKSRLYAALDKLKGQLEEQHVV